MAEDSQELDEKRFMLDLKKFLRKVIPVVREMAEITVHSENEKNDLTKYGWYYCLVDDCGNADKIPPIYRIKSNHSAHMKKNHGSSPSVKETQIIIIHNEASLSQFADDPRPTTPLLKLLKKWYDETSQPTAGEDPKNMPVTTGFVCLLKDCALDKFMRNESNTDEEVKNHIRHNHTTVRREDIGEIFNIHVIYKEITDIKIRKVEDVETDKVEIKIEEADLTLVKGEGKTFKCECECEIRIWQTHNCEGHPGEITWGEEDFTCHFCAVEQREKINEEIKDAELAMKRNGNPCYCAVCKQNFNIQEHLKEGHKINLRTFLECYPCRKRYFTGKNNKKLAEHVATAEHASGKKAKTE